MLALLSILMIFLLLFFLNGLKLANETLLFECISNDFLNTSRAFFFQTKLLLMYFLFSTELWKIIRLLTLKAVLLMDYTIYIYCEYLVSVALLRRKWPKPSRLSKLDPLRSFWWKKWEYLLQILIYRAFLAKFSIFTYIFTLNWLFLARRWWRHCDVILGVLVRFLLCMEGRAP